MDGYWELESIWEFWAQKKKKEKKKTVAIHIQIANFGLR